MHDWTNTTLWTTLEKSAAPDAAAARLLVQPCMPIIQSVLAQAATSPETFTLHDSEHSFRVAQRMTEIIPSDVLVALSPFELALALLAAYLHDIGMTPESSRLQAHRAYLLDRDTTSLTNQETADFQRWLDESGESLPIAATDQRVSEQVASADELLSQYCRMKHVDWSDDWVVKHLGQIAVPGYVDCLSDLRALCRSHHQGYAELARSRFEPRIVGSHGAVVHLRYLAVMLRVADVMEFDPERTPEVVFRHRMIAASSLIYWWKDHYISIVQSGDQVQICARPSTASVHRAVEITAEQVDAELALARALSENEHFEKLRGSRADLPHRWTLPSRAHRIIEPQDDSYEYINGAFRPDTHKLLSLLSGNALYGSVTASVRELLQNAFDAVRQQMAYQRLSVDGSKSAVDAIAALHRVRLSVDGSDGRLWLVCADTGVGITRNLLENHLLVSGNSSTHEVAALERRCRDAGFELERTGQFGIGVLSYFMLADRVVISTRRSIEAGDAEQTGWTFQTDGVGTFGELRKRRTTASGTEVRLRLRAEAKSPDETLRDVYNAVRGFCRRIPCPLEIDIGPSMKATLPHGWTERDEDAREFALSGRRYDHLTDSRTVSDLVTTYRRKKSGETVEEQHRAAVEVASALRLTQEEGELPNGAGYYRIRMPDYELPGGRSLIALRPHHDASGISLRTIHKSLTWVSAPRAVFSWRGMLAAPVEPSVGPIGQLGGDAAAPGERSRIGIVEIDLTSRKAATISVSRRSLQLDESGSEAVAFVRGRESALLRQWLEENRSSPYGTVSARYVGEPAPLSQQWWVTGEPADSGACALRAVTPPAISSLAFVYQTDRSVGTEILWRNRPVQVLRGLREKDDEPEHYKGRAWAGGGHSPSHIVLVPLHSRRVTALWDRIAQDPIPPSRPLGPMAQVAPTWNRLVAVRFESYYQLFRAGTVWNACHPIPLAVTEDALRWCSAELPRSLDPRRVASALVADSAKASAWITRCIEAYAWELWEALVDQEAAFLGAVWRRAIPSGADPGEGLLLWNEIGGSSSVHKISADGWRVLGKPDARQLLPDPGEEWTLQFVGPDEGR